MRILIWCWLGFQGLLLAAIVATHGPGMEPDLRLLSAAAMILGSFPLGLLALYGALAALEGHPMNVLLSGYLIKWVACFLAGALEIWLLNVLIKSRRPHVRL